jgi:hypothetical protein
MRFSISFFLAGIITLFLGVIIVLAGADVKVNQDSDTSVQNEPSIIINRHFPGDLLNMVVAYNDIGRPLGISYSADSGKVWNDTQLDSVWATTGDPSVASDINGNVYACFLSYEGTWFYGKSGIFVSKSTDGGRNWLSPVAADSLVYTGGSAVPFADKCLMTVDTNNTSPYVGNIYVGWQRDDTNGQNSDIFFARSTDGGLSFSTPIQINDNPPQTASAEGAFPFVGADGDIYVAWYDAYFRGHEPGSLYVDKSTDGGQTFGVDIKIANILTPPLYTFGNTGFKAKSFVSAAGDPNNSELLYLTYISDPDGYFDKRVDNGKPPGVLGGAGPSDQPAITRNGNFVYMAWEDYRNGMSDIYFNRSTNNGQTWNLPDKGPLDNTDLAPGANASQWVRLNSSGPNVYCVWHDYRSPSGFVDIYFNYSLDNGASWKMEQHIDGSTTASSMFPSIASTDSFVYVAWQDNRLGNDDIYFNRSTNNGMAWGTPTRIDLGDGAGANSSKSARLACQGSYVYCMWLDIRTGGTYHTYFNYSTDNGVTWQVSSIKLSQGTGSWCQLPARGCLECTSSFVYACWAEDRDTTGVYGIYFNRSTNSGVSWGTDARVSDSGYTCYNTSLDLQGNYVYIGWEDNRLTGYTSDDIFFDYSSDNGATWQSPDIGPIDAAVGIPAMCVDIKSEGNFVYATWYDSRRMGPGTGDVFFNRSTNNGATWQADVRINTGTQSFALQFNYPIMAAGNGYVNIAWADPRFFGLPNIYINYSTDNGATWLTGQDEADVFCVRSTDGGAIWQTPVRVNDDGTAYAQVLPWVVVKNNGLVDISYYHFRMTPLNMWAPGAEVRMAVSSNGGVSFDPSFMVQDTVVTPTIQWVGEYNGMAVLDSFVFTVFTDLEQTGNSDIYIDRTVNPKTTSIEDEVYNNPVNIQNIDLITLYQNYPNPFNPETNIEFLLRESGPVKIEIYNLLGQKVRILMDQYLEKGQRSVKWDGKDQAGKDLASGVYWYRIQAKEFSQTRKMLLLK